MSFYMRLKGFDDLAKKLQELSQTEIWSKSPMVRAMAYIHSEVPEYPMAKPKSKYRRTGTLGRSITTEVKSLTGNRAAGTIGTKTVYAPWVISSEKVGNRGPQARWNKGRWWTLQGVVEKAMPKVREIFSTEIKRLIG